MKIIVFLLLATLFAFLNAETVYACSCPSFGPPEVQTRQQEINLIVKSNDTAVFTGEVISINDDTDERDYRDITFKVEQYWNGNVSREFTVRTNSLDGGCTFHFRIGTSYLVFASLHENRIYTGECSRNQELQKATDDLKHLGKGKAPIAKKVKGV